MKSHENVWGGGYPYVSQSFTWIISDVSNEFTSVVETLYFLFVVN